MPTLKAIWKSKKTDLNNGGYNQELLESVFSKYGPLHHVLVSSKRNGKALVSFQHPFDAVSLENEDWGEMFHLYIVLQLKHSYSLIFCSKEHLRMRKD